MWLKISSIWHVCSSYFMFLIHFIHENTGRGNSWVESSVSECCSSGYFWKKLPLFQRKWTYWVVGCCGPKVSNIWVITDVISSSRHTQKSSQHVRACATGDGAICSENRKIVPYHGDSPSSRISARLRSQSPIMAPGIINEISVRI